jgi:histone deacetylase complex regulatory component SIN3
MAKRKFAKSKAGPASKRVRTLPAAEILSSAAVLPAEDKEEKEEDAVLCAGCLQIEETNKTRLKERVKLCSGRDEMCRSVLNDDWASHPTWASEDSGFVAHRKNQYEEGLHRIEEERHDYDFNIEANAKVIQLLEPIGQSLLSMDPMERESFRMPLGLGGQSQAIYKRVLKKIYSDKGPEVAADLFRDPGAVLPIVLARLKQKDEEWRFTQVRKTWYLFFQHPTDT